MSVAAQSRRPELAAVPAELASPCAKLVYLSLATAERATADELAERLGMKKLTLFSVLATLEKRGVVASDGDAYALA